MRVLREGLIRMQVFLRAASRFAVFVCAASVFAQSPVIERDAPHTTVPPRHRTKIVVTTTIGAPCETPEVHMLVEGAHLNTIAKSLGHDAVSALVRGLLGASAFDELAGIFGTADGSNEALRAALDGRIIMLAGEGWALAVDAGPAGNRALLHSLGAQLVSPGVFEIKSQDAVARTCNGWLLFAPRDFASERIANALIAMLPMQDAALPPEVGLRVGIRHILPTGGATAISVTTREGKLVVSVEGQYKKSPLGAAELGAKLDGAIISKFEGAACVALAQPCDGVPSAGQAFWIAVLPELLPPPAMRANLSGEKLFVVGRGCAKGAPSVACCVRVDDFDQAVEDQRTYMMRVESGIIRSISGGGGMENGTGSGSVGAAPRPLLGRFIEQQFGRAIRLGSMSLCWRTVPTPCGGWQVYASDPTWLDSVSGELERAGCPEGVCTVAAGAGFVDGPRAAALLRAWKPLQRADAAEQSAGMDALASLIEGIGVVRFRYSIPQEGRVSAELLIEPPSALPSLSQR
ncbi:MAG: hypothetical protein EXS10_02115 [Phycisphaerales bacterium]|nr:hypothetical protein [Phycisphaerales bacterium]